MYSAKATLYFISLIRLVHIRLIRLSPFTKWEYKKKGKKNGGKMGNCKKVDDRVKVRVIRLWKWKTFISFIGDSKGNISWALNDIKANISKWMCVLRILFTFFYTREEIETKKEKKLFFLCFSLKFRSREMGLTTGENLALH